MNTITSLEEIEMYRYTYNVSGVELTLDNTNYVFEDGTCIYFMMHHDYLNRRFPIIELGIECDSDLIEEFFKYKDTAKLKLEVIEKQLDSNGNVVNTSIYIRHTFSCVSAKDQTAYITTPDNMSKDSIDPMRKLQALELYLIDMDMVNKFAKEIAIILENVTKAAALQLCFSNRDVLPGTIIATPPQSEKTLDYISLPLGDLVSNITTIHTKYGLYDATPIVYYDYKYIYCLNSLTPNIIMKETTEFGNITFLLINESNPEHNVVGSATLTDQKTHIINLQDEPEIYDTSERRTSTKFSTLLTVSSNGTVNQRTMDEENTKAQFIRELNDLTQDQYVNQVMKGHQLSINTNSCCISVLRPYKTYRFDVDTQYSDKGLTGHEYRLTSLTLDIRRDSPTKYIHAITINLQRPYDADEE